MNDLPETSKAGKVKPKVCGCGTELKRWFQTYCDDTNGGMPYDEPIGWFCPSCGYEEADE